MNIPSDAPNRPAIRYYGGKWRIAPWIINHLPRTHECYVEPFAGGASVLLRKPRSPLEIYNDLNGAVVNFFRVLREEPDELLRAIHLTPWARAEYELSQEPADDPIEEARRFYVSAWMGFGGGRAKWRQGWRYQVKAGTLWKPSSISFTEINHLYQIVERLQGVQIECKDAFDIIRSCDAPTTLFYLDPPYLHSTRSKWKDVYAHEMERNDHQRLLESIQELTGMVAISGYPSKLYDTVLSDWCRVTTAARTNGGGAISSAERTEVLWLSPALTKALDKEQLPLFHQD